MHGKASAESTRITGLCDGRSLGAISHAWFRLGAREVPPPREGGRKEGELAIMKWLFVSPEPGEWLYVSV
jgi:hypothetical protein